jgi:hypothetical protein
MEHRKVGIKCHTSPAVLDAPKHSLLLLLQQQQQHPKPFQPKYLQQRRVLGSPIAAAAADGGE